MLPVWRRTSLCLLLLLCGCIVGYDGLSYQAPAVQADKLPLNVAVVSDTFELGQAAANIDKAMFRIIEGSFRTVFWLDEKATPPRPYDLKATLSDYWTWTGDRWGAKMVFETVPPSRPLVLDVYVPVNSDVPSLYPKVLARMTSELRAQAPPYAERNLSQRLYGDALGAEARGDAALTAADPEAAVREYGAALRHLTTWFTGPAAGHRIRISSKAIRASGEIKERRVGEDFRREMISGLAAAKMARDQNEYREAIRRFRAASALAPWMPQPYEAIANVAATAEDFGGAARYLELYLQANPNAGAAETRQTRDRIYEWEAQARIRAQRSN